MNYTIAKEIMDAKPEQAEHLYIDETDTPRDKHIENLFRDLFAGAPLDQLFRNNLQVYLSELLGVEVTPPQAMYIDANTAISWLSAFVGPISVRPINASDAAALADDPACAQCRYVARIKPFTTPKRIKPAYAPSALHATFLAAVFVLRAEADKRLRKLFAPAYKAG